MDPVLAFVGEARGPGAWGSAGDGGDSEGQAQLGAGRLGRPRADARRRGNTGPTFRKNTLKKALFLIPVIPTTSRTSQPWRDAVA